jgi:hypothetical protein
MKYSVKHILNKHLKAIETPDGVRLYPLYVQVIFKRKNYMFKSLVENYSTDIKFIGKDQRKLMSAELELIEDILKFEMDLKGEKFEINGFSNRYNHYRLSAFEQGQIVLLDQIIVFLKRESSRYLDIINDRYSPGKCQLLLDALHYLHPEIVQNIEFKKFLFTQRFWDQYKKTFPENRVENLVRPSIFDWISGDHLSSMKNVLQDDPGEYSVMDFQSVNHFDSVMKKVTIKA